jgi:HPt (histidine-containing phosphotransfer) domain-containing protein
LPSRSIRCNSANRSWRSGRESIMDERDELQQKIADIAGRYIQRTAGELAGLRDLIAKVRTGNIAAVKDIQQLAHKIYGSGSMFGFEAVSEQARQLEVAARGTIDAQMIDKLELHADALEQQVQAALRARGVK